MTSIERADRPRHVSCLAQVRDEIPGFVTLRTRNARFRPIIVQLKYWGSLKLRLCLCKWDMKPGQQWAEECSDARQASHRSSNSSRGGGGTGEMSLGNSWWVFVTGEVWGHPVHVLLASWPVLISDKSGMRGISYRSINQHIFQSVKRVWLSKIIGSWKEKSSYL